MARCFGVVLAVILWCDHDKGEIKKRQALVVAIQAPIYIYIHTYMCVYIYIHIYIYIYIYIINVGG